MCLQLDGRRCGGDVAGAVHDSEVHSAVTGRGKTSAGKVDGEGSESGLGSRDDKSQ